MPETGLLQTQSLPSGTRTNFQSGKRFGIFNFRTIHI